MLPNYRSLQWNHYAARAQMTTNVSDPELSSDGKPQIQLFESALSEEYTCLSYTWGQENDGGGPFPILINGKTFPIRRNLKIFLHIAMRKYPKQRIWIDAICIDQGNNAEKSDQVSRMGEIYSLAVRVYAWLGEASRETDLVFAVLQQFRDRKREEACPTSFDAAEQLSIYQQLFRDIYQEEAGSLPDQCEWHDKTLHKEFNWLRPLYERCYWQRVWIVQELVLAKTVIVHCGDKSIDFDDIYGLSPDWGSFEQEFDMTGYNTVKQHTKGWRTIRTIHGHRSRRKIVEWKMDGEALYSMNIKMSEKGDVAVLDEVIRIYAKHHECSCLKDKIYGFRELISRWKEELVVDYKKSDLEVFLDVARLGLFDSKQYGGQYIACCLWEAMKLGNSEDFSDCIRQHLPELDV
ncbi:unnamed protein product [Periconia digitata]|uniref:Heterokaryon incompatibility domain-containing protein n=1 Tax=Periconia digitata TaxID=1303443 RepID=A0A9W4UVR0_9PLEO|nr:unnamed protein product [Periconia digitata]